jgi:23S rRNA (cytidine1920-2'-O)/16S rRNA (cytidine1409-2'-O)-methyltransferase
MAAGKKRLDLLVLEKGIVNSRQRAQALIMAGKVLVNNHIADKPGTLVSQNDHIVLQGKDHPYVSRGGLKLEKALHTLGTDIKGFVCLDVGASTGGFTDCLLQHGAGRVYAVDVGYGQLAWELKQNPRVVVIDRMNIRHMQPETIPQPVDLVTIDVSFISLKKVVPEIVKFMKKNAGILALIKPQFEVGKKNVGKGGVVRDPVLHDQVVDNLSDFFKKKHLFNQWVIPSPILGPKGNKEFFISLIFKSCP